MINEPISRVLKTFKRVMVAEQPCLAQKNRHFSCFVSSTETKIPKKLKGWYASVVRRPFSNSFFFKTSVPISNRFHMQVSDNRGTTLCSNGLGHMIKMAAMPKGNKTLKIFSSPEPHGYLYSNLVCSIKWPDSTEFVQMMTLCWSRTVLR